MKRDVRGRLRQAQLPVGWQRVLVAGFLVLAVGRTWTCAHRPGDFRLYTWTGEAALAHADLYHGCPWGACTWPPIFSLGCIPFALLTRWSETGARAIWLALNAGALAAILRILAAWAYPGAAWRWWPARGAVSPGAVEVALPLLVCGRFLLVNAEFLQVNLLVLLGAVAGVWWIARGREGAGAALVGLAGALKILPWLLVPWLFWRGRRRAAVLAGLAGVGWTLLPAGWFGWGRFVGLLRDWPRAVAEGWGVNGPNQSVPAMVDRFVGHGVTPSTAASFPFEFVAGSGSPVVPWITLALVAVAVAGAVLAWRRPLNLASPAGLAEAGAVLGAAVLFAPLAWVHYFVVLLVPAAGTLAVLRGRRLPDPDARWCAAGLGLAATLTWVTSRAVAGPWLAKVGLSLSVVTLAGLVLVVASGWAAARSRS